jgi:hypothetical protein
MQLIKLIKPDAANAANSPGAGDADRGSCRRIRRGYGACRVQQVLDMKEVQRIREDGKDRKDRRDSWIIKMQAYQG